MRVKLFPSAILALFVLCGCTSVPKADAFRRTSAVLAAPNQAGMAVDGRARFRQLYCQVVRRDGSNSDARCESSLWRLSDEAGPLPDAAPLPTPRTDLRMLIIPGALNDCFGQDAQPFTGGGVARLRSLGVRIDTVPVSGRSSSEHNARQIANFLSASDLAHSEPIIMLGYSKGAVDIQQFLSDFPDYARRVVGIVAIAGPVWGSPIADSSEWLYSMLSHTFSGRCDPGDAGLLRSLRTDVRTEWQHTHPLPAGIGYYFVGAFTTSEHLARGLRPTWRSLAKTETRNDGQVRLEDEVQPGGVLLGYVNADHWGAAIQVEKELDYIAHRKAGNGLPQSALLEAAWLYVGEALPAGKSP